MSIYGIIWSPDGGSPAYTAGREGGSPRRSPLLLGREDLLSHIGVQGGQIYAIRLSWGLSYGGFFTLIAMTDQPTLFKAGVDVAGVVDYVM